MSPSEKSYAPVAILLVISVIWGLTWIAFKVGVQSIPPLMFTGSRFAVAGLALALLYPVLSRRPAPWTPLARQWVRLAILSVLLVMACYGALSWAIQHIPSGVTGVINLALVPICLLMFGVLFGMERLNAPRLAAIALGWAGLGLMFMPQIQGGGDMQIEGMAAVVGGTVSAALGSVLSRHWFSGADVLQVSAVTMLAGGLGLMAVSIAVEPGAVGTLHRLLEPETALAWGFLVLAGSLGAYTLYLHLVRTWGPSRSGLYAFLSPVIAVLAGWAVLDEALGPVQLVASALLILAAGMTVIEGLWRPRG